MIVQVLEYKEDFLKVKIHDMEDKHTVPNLLVYKLNKHPNVVMAGYREEHPLSNVIEFAIRTKDKDPLEVLKECVEEIEKELKELKEAWLSSKK